MPVVYLTLVMSQPHDLEAGVDPPLAGLSQVKEVLK